MPTEQELHSGEPVIVSGTTVCYLGPADSGARLYDVAGRQFVLGGPVDGNVQRLERLIAIAADG